MVPILLMHPDIEKRQSEAEKLLAEAGFFPSHPDLKWFGAEEKLGIEQARQIKDFLSLKPFQGKGQAIVILAAENLTPEAQNALLKTLEEPVGEATFILGVSSEDQLLATIVSRCQIVNLKDQKSSIKEIDPKDQVKIETLIGSTMEERFKFIEKLDDREGFLLALTLYFRKQLPRSQARLFLKDLLEAEKWARQNVNIRAILEYLMLKIPTV